MILKGGPGRRSRHDVARRKRKEAWGRSEGRWVDNDICAALFFFTMIRFLSELLDGQCLSSPQVVSRKVIADFSAFGHAATSVSYLRRRGFRSLRGGGGGGGGRFIDR